MVESSEPVPVTSANENDGTMELNLSVPVTLKFEIAGNNKSSEDDMVRIITAIVKDKTDHIGGEIAEMLEKVFANMPLKEA